MAAWFNDRAWAFCHFLWNYDRGLYREVFLQHLGTVLDGTDSTENFAKVLMKRPSASSWGDVEMQFEWYWRQLVQRKVGKDPTTHADFTPSTDAPEGRPDEDYVRAWKANHPPK
jgi:hypothetical protein